MLETMTQKRDSRDKCRKCGCADFNPFCDACLELEEILLQHEQGVEGYDV